MKLLLLLLLLLFISCNGRDIVHINTANWNYIIDIPANDTTCPIKKVDTARVTYFAASRFSIAGEYVPVIRKGYMLSYKGELVIYLRPDGLKEEHFIQLIKEGW